MIKALIFDFDGVLILSEKARFHVLQSMAKRQNVEISDKLFSNIVGRTTKDFFRLNFPLLNAETLEKIIEDYTAEYKDKIVEHVTPIAFTNDFIRQYDGDKVIAVTSGSDTRIIERLLSHLDLRDKISCVVGKEHVTKHKPDPQAYLYTAAQLGLQPQSCIVFEDTSVGAEAAFKAGMQVFAILNGLNSAADFSPQMVSGYIADYEDLVTAVNSDVSG
jgi:beta-phosphoglucomutase